MGREITCTATTLLPHPPDRVWAAVTDLDRWQWRSGLGNLERTGENGFVEYDRRGFPTHFTVTDCHPPLFWAFDLENANLTGRWTGAFRPEGGGTRVVFTEHITPKKPWMRLFAKGYLRRQQARYLSDLERALERLADSGKK